MILWLFQVCILNSNFEFCCLDSEYKNISLASLNFLMCPHAIGNFVQCFLLHCLNTYSRTHASNFSLENHKTEVTRGSNSIYLDTWMFTTFLSGLCLDTVDSKRIFQNHPSISKLKLFLSAFLITSWQKQQQNSLIIFKWSSGNQLP